MRRVSLVGVSGAGKSTLGRALARRLDVPFVELDSIYHQPGWQPLPVEDFVDRVDAATGSDGWVVDGNYSAVRELVWSRADTVVWLDLPRYRVMRQIIVRTVRRAALRVELWNGNRERWRNLFARDPKESVIVFAWQRHTTLRERYLAASLDPARGHLTFVRIRSRSEARAFLDRVVRRP